MSNESYQNITLQFSQVAAGQMILLDLVADGTPISFSGGPAGPSSGMQIQAQPSLLLSSFTLSSAELRIIVAPAAADTSSFSVKLYLAANPGIVRFFLKSRSDPGVQASAALGFATPQTVGTTNTPFSWNPW
ncbi:hypothetical protein IGB42_01826 [Andreprevotia sp. IGB-42]|uniref:hypothetical protein n=1 Tax=Andreprevotia sp. IGB-42 TaxID=2497473 RepID=UPI00135ADE95|nr:hypothetical protein [Andreprevotia sp. IGB-42]KAF0813475.1 hypothetical protein IGB42_01826 [Andreprevotia sp. IGB-42]